MYASNELWFRHIFQETQFLHVGCWCCDVCCDIIISYAMLHCVVLCRAVIQVCTGPWVPSEMKSRIN